MAKPAKIEEPQEPIGPDVPASLPKRFHDKIMADPNSGCWLWTAAISKSGYGVFGRGPKAYGTEGAHRIAWLLYYGEVPPGLYVLHKCDVRACCNPSHLFLGTQADNMADMIAKGRYVKHFGRGGCRGDENPSRKLTSEAVREIKRMRGVKTGLALAQHFGVTENTIRRIYSGETWGHI